MLEADFERQREREFVPGLIQRGASILGKLQQQPQRNSVVETEIADVFTQLVKRQNYFLRYGLDIESSMPWISFPQKDDEVILKARAHFVDISKYIGEAAEHKDKWMLGVIVPSRNQFFYIPVEGVKSVKSGDLKLLISDVEGSVPALLKL